MHLPAGRLNDRRNGGALRPAQQHQHRSLFRPGMDVVLGRLSASPSIGSSFPSAALQFSELYAWPCFGSSLGDGALSRRHHRNPAEARRRWRGRGTAGLETEPISRRAPLPTTDALFAQGSRAESEQCCCSLAPSRSSGIAR
jgi:hypothetical protein